MLDHLDLDLAVKYEKRFSMMFESGEITSFFEHQNFPRLPSEFLLFEELLVECLD